MAPRVRAAGQLAADAGHPIERVMVLGTMLIGAYLAMNDPTGYMVGGLFAFMMLAQRVAQPLVGLARLVEDYEEVGAAIGEAASVLNRPLESEFGFRRPAAEARRRHQLPGPHLHLYRHQDAGARPGQLRHSRPAPCSASSGAAARANRRSPACCRGSTAITAASSRSTASTCAKSTCAICARASAWCCRSNFLFRGSIRDNIIAGRPGLTLSDADACRASRRRRGIHRADAERLRDLH